MTAFMNTTHFNRFYTNKKTQFENNEFLCSTYFLIMKNDFLFLDIEGLAFYHKKHVEL